VKRRRVLVAASGSLLAGFAVLNALAFAHAGSLTRYSDSGERTEAPQRLSRAGKLRALILGPNVPRPRNDATPAAFGLAFETETFDSEGARIEAWRVPCDRAKGAVVLAHGYAAAKSSQLHIAKTLHELGWEAYLVDLRGSGGSTGDGTTLGWREADDVARAVERATRDRPPVLWGTSMGAAAVLRAVSRGTPARGLVLEAPFPRLIDAVRSRFAIMGAPSFPSAELLVFWGGVRGGFDGFALEPVEWARSARAPALVLHGEADPTVSVEQVREVAGALAGPKTLVTFPGVGHESTLSARPAEARVAVASFLGGL
jgi:alpha-beta hydrolase superfamily lysophospholipase